MTRITGRVHPTKYSNKQCTTCKRYFNNIKIHEAMGSACKIMRGIHDFKGEIIKFDMETPN